MKLLEKILKAPLACRTYRKIQTRKGENGFDGKGTFDGEEKPGIDQRGTLRWKGNDFTCRKTQERCKQCTFKRNQQSFLSKFFILKKTIFLNVVWKILANVANLRKSIASVIRCFPDVIDSK